MHHIYWPFWLILFTVALTRADELSLEPDSVSKNYADELPRIPPTEPDDTLAKFQIVDGFRIELAAHEPLISDPISMAFDEHGRLFVVCMRGYSEHREDRIGVVRLLEDTNADGVFDSGTDYVKGLAWPTAIACFDGGIFVGAPPNILYCKDTDNDGVADEQEIVFTGFGHQNVQGMLNSFRWGLDNRLYGATGTNGGQVKKNGDSSEPISLRGRDFAIEPETLTLRPESGGAQHGATFDRWGERYVCSNSDHLQWIRHEDRHLARNSILAGDGYRSRQSIATDGPAAEVFRTSDVEPWRVVRTRLRVKGMVGGPVEGGGRASGYFTSASGVTAYTGDAFPSKYRNGNYVFVGDVGSNLVHLKHIGTDGLERTASRATGDNVEFLTSTDNWFRPVQFRNGPDGALYVIDMYRETIEHPLSLPPMIKKHVDLNSGRSRGRLYRIVPNDWQNSPRAMPRDANDEQLVPMLSHSNGWHRETAARLLVRRASESDARREQLAGLLRDNASASPDGRIRSLYCLQSLGRLSEGGLIHTLNDKHAQVRRHALKVVESADSVGEATITQLQSMSEDKDERVRYQLALTWGRFSWDVRAEPLVELASQPLQPAMHFALYSSIGERRLEMLQLLLGGDKSDDALLLAESIARQIGQKRKAVGDAIHVINPQPTDLRDRLMGNVLLGTGLNGERLIDFLSSQNIKDPKALVNRIGAKSKKQALNDQDPVVFRLMAMHLSSLGEYQEVSAAFDKLLSPQQPAVIRDAAVEQLGKYKSTGVAEALLSRLPSLSPKGRRKAVDLLVSRPAWAKLLLDHIADQNLSSSQIPALYRQQLINHRSEEIAELAQEVLGAKSDRGAVVERMTSRLEGSGDVARGKLAFQKVCSTCHRLDGHGSDVGPNLQPLRNRGAAFMLTQILDPNREVDARYEAYSIVTHDGRTQSGILTSDTTSAFTILQADGKSATLPKGDVEVFQATGRSLMPEGLEQELTEQGVADVIAYLIHSDSLDSNASKP